MKKRVVPLAVALAVTTSVAFVPNAHALPTGCSTTGTANGKFIGTCTGGHGQFRMKVDCRYASDRQTGWVSVGKTVTLGCLIGRAAGASLELRN